MLNLGYQSQEISVAWSITEMTANEDWYGMFQLSCYSLELSSDGAFFFILVFSKERTQLRDRESLSKSLFGEAEVKRETERV